MIDWIEFTVTTRAERLTRWETENETEMRSSATNINSPFNKRFIQIETEDIPNFVSQQSNKDTLSKTYYDLKRLVTFLHQEYINEKMPIHQTAPIELCTLLCRFFLSVRKSDESSNEPTSLHGFMSSYERHLRHKDYEYSFSSPDYEYSLSSSPFCLVPWCMGQTKGE